MKNYKVVFDIDDTLNNLVTTTYTQLAMMDKYPMKKRYYLKDCTELTDAEKIAVENAWHDPVTYLACAAHKGIEKIDILAKKDNVDAWIHSYCTNEATKSAKYQWLHNYLNCEKLQMNLEVGSKTPMVDADFVVEDNIAYLSKCGAKHRLLIDKPDNQAENYPELDLTGIIRVYSLDEAIEYIRNVVNN